MFKIAVSENIRPGEFLMRLNMAYDFYILLFMHSSLIDLINIKAMLVLFSLQAKRISLQLLQMFHLPDKIQFYAPNLQEKSKLSTLLKYNWDTLDFFQKIQISRQKNWKNYLQSSSTNAKSLEYRTTFVYWKPNLEAELS